MFATVPFFCAISDPPTQIISLLLLAVSLDPDDDVTLASRHSIMTNHQPELA